MIADFYKCPSYLFLGQNKKNRKQIKRKQKKKGRAHLTWPFQPSRPNPPGGLPCRLPPLAPMLLGGEHAPAASPPPALSPSSPSRWTTPWRLQALLPLSQFVSLSLSFVSHAQPRPSQSAAVAARGHRPPLEQPSCPEA